jgi:hypothetical protein
LLLQVPVTDEELIRIEGKRLSKVVFFAPYNHVADIARSQIERDLPVYAQVLPLDKAMGINSLRAVFGEKYPDPVRVVSVGRPIDELVAKPQVRGEKKKENRKGGRPDAAFFRILPTLTFRLSCAVERICLEREKQSSFASLPRAEFLREFVVSLQ